jgi:hypothetical protein
MSLFPLEEFIIVGLAVWRLSSLIVNEDGPFEVFAKFRDFSGVRYDSFSKPYGKNQFANLITCVWCTSVWVGLLLATGYFLAPTVTIWVSVPLGLSSLAVIIEEFNSKE